MTGLVCTPLLAEWCALRPRLGADLVRTGRATGRIATSGRSLLVAGTAGAVSTEARPGDLVVADELRDSRGVRRNPAAPLLTAALRRAGLPVTQGPVATTPRIIDDPAARQAHARAGTIAVDTESALLADTAGPDRTSVVRAVVDTPEHRLLRPGTVPRGIRGLASLRRAADVIDAWAAAAIDRDVVLAAPRSFCAGVDRAIEVVERALERFGAPVYVRRQIVHNQHVVWDLESRGAVFVDEVEQIPPGSVTILSAHGVAPHVREDAAARDLSVVDATCPLVTKVHNEVRRFADRDATVFLIGHREHEEVVGTRGEAPDNVVVVSDPEEAARARAQDPDKVSYVMQTTLSAEEAEATAAVLRERFPALAGPRRDDICYATTNRQQAVRAVARSCDLVLVLGSQNSSNSQRLAEVAVGAGAEAHLVDDACQVDLGWLAGASRVGITAGASAPPHLVDELVRCLSGLGNVTVTETNVATEDVHFALPREVS